MMKSCTDTFFTRLFSAKDDDVVAIVKGKRFSSCQMVNSIATLVQALNQRSQSRWLLWADSAYEFAIGLFALGFAGKHVVMPGNIQAEYLKKLQASFDAVLCNIELPVTAQAQINLSDFIELDSAERATLDNTIDPDTPVTLYTSGTTGDAKAVCKTFELLATEVLAQDAMWNERVGSFPVISTVGHQHIYGLLHYLLWPWFRGAPIIDPPIHLREEIVSVANSHSSGVLISSPTHLHRIYEQDIEVRFRAVFSSAGLLEKTKSGLIEQYAGVAPIEIFGSTETGGVAWRQQALSSSDDALWRGLSGVDISRDIESGCLNIQSRFMVEDNYLMSDRISEPRHDRFALLGRIDRIVKVEGKRLSIDEMQSKLLAHDFVEAVRLLVLKKRREEVCAVLCLSEKGQHALKEGKRHVNDVFRLYLSQSFELPLVPRRWRYVNELPVDAQGKVTLLALESLFARGS